MPGLDVWVSSKPRQHHSGDGGEVHFISSCASGRITRMLLADVCSQDAGFVELSTELRALMMKNANAINQGRFVQAMNERFGDFAAEGAFATGLVTTFFAPTRSFNMCNAGSPSPLIYRQAVGEWSLLKPSVPQESTSPGDAPDERMLEDEYQQLSTRLEDGDMVLSYSNVLTECRDANGQLYGTQGLVELVKQCDPAKPAELVASLMRLVDSEDGLATDATILLCQAKDRSVGWKNNLLAPFRLLGSVADNTQLR